MFSFGKKLKTIIEISLYCYRIIKVMELKWCISFIIFQLCLQSRAVVLWKSGNGGDNPPPSGT